MCHRQLITVYSVPSVLASVWVWCVCVPTEDKLHLLYNYEIQCITNNNDDDDDDHPSKRAVPKFCFLGPFCFPHSFRLLRSTYPINTIRPTHLVRQLVLEPLQVEVQIGLVHLLAAAARQLGQDVGRHVDDEAVLAVQQVEEGAPDALLALDAVADEHLDAGPVLLQDVVDQHQHVLDGLILGDVRQQVDQGLGALVRVLLDVLGPLVVQRRDALKVLVRDHLGPESGVGVGWNHGICFLRPNLHNSLLVGHPVDFLRTDLAGLLLQLAGGRNHFCGDRGTGSEWRRERMANCDLVEFGSTHRFSCRATTTSGPASCRSFWVPVGSEGTRK